MVGECSFISRSWFKEHPKWMLMVKAWWGKFKVSTYISIIVVVNKRYF
jgi:hypothetical protein